MSKRPKSLRSAVLGTALVLIAFLAADGLLFRTGWYFDYIEPGSSIGQLESHLNWLERTPKTPGEREVLVIGDSRIGEGLSVPIATEAAGPRFRFWNFGIAGSTPRVWYYALRATDLDRSRFSAIVIALGQYTDEDDENEADREIDLNFVIARLGLVDCFGFSRSFSTFAYQRRALVGCLFRGVTLRTDIKAFLLGVTRRVQKHNDWFENGLKYTTEYPGKPEDFTGQSVNFAMQMQRVPQTGATTRYRNQWLGNILDLYRDSATGIIFVQLPRAPVHLPPSEAPARFLDAALQRPHVSAIPAESFADLETPELFADGLHLNRSGRAEFSRRLAKFVQAAVDDR